MGANNNIQSKITNVRAMLELVGQELLHIESKLGVVSPPASRKGLYVKTKRAAAIVSNRNEKLLKRKQ